MQFDIHRWWARSQWSDTARISLYRKISKMLANGLPLLKILEELWGRASFDGRRPNEPLAVILDDCKRMVQNGHMLSEGLTNWIPKGEKMILLAGEQSGHLEGTLLSVIEVAQSSRKIRNVILGGIAYPIAVLSLIIVYIYLFGTRVIPEFGRVVDPHTWHGAAKSLYLMSLFVEHGLLFLTIALVAMASAVILSMPHWRGDIRVVMDRFPPYSIYRLMTGSSFLLAFSSLQSAGITVEKSLIRLSEIADPWLRERLDGALLGVKSGLNCGEALKNSGYGFPSREIVEDLCIYAEYKGFSNALKLLADEWMHEGIEIISMHMKILNGASIVVLALVIGWLITGFFGIQHEIATMTSAIR